MHVSALLESELCNVLEIHPFFGEAKVTCHAFVTRLQGRNSCTLQQNSEADKPVPCDNTISIGIIDGRMQP